MQIVKFGQQLNTPVVLCLGYFETMHLGHRSLLACAKDFTSRQDCKTALFTFDHKGDEEVYTVDERMHLYAELGVDYVVYADFTPSFKQTRGKDFVADLFATINIKALVCGTDYTFGCDRCGTFELTRFICGRCPLFVVKPVVSDDLKVSSTTVRSLLKQGDLTTANKLLGQPYFIEGTVCHGRGVGKTIGFPTANIAVSPDKILPQGVFGGVTNIDGTTYPVIVNIGGKPTFDVANPTVEVHVIGFGGDLYERQLTVRLTEFLRATTKFDTVDELVLQLQRDVDKVKEIYNDQIRS